MSPSSESISPNPKTNETYIKDSWAFTYSNLKSILAHPLLTRVTLLKQTSDHNIVNEK